VKYLMATIILVFSLFIGWFASAKYLEPVILSLFSPETHDKYLDIWFSIFAAIELIIILAYMTYVYKVHKSNRHLTKNSGGR
jgi:divalent metal cation (Fe/Co/Zn/Cd) transporter